MGDSTTQWAKNIQEDFRSFVRGGCKEPNPKYKLRIHDFVHAKASDIHHEALLLIDKLYVPDGKKIFVDLHLAVMTEVSAYLKAHPDVKAKLTSEDQENALKLSVRKKSRPWTTIVCQLYKISEMSQSVIAKTINDLIESSRYTEAAFLIIELKLQKSYDIKSVVVPLLLEDKVNVMEDYIKDCPEIASEFLKYLDSVRYEPSVVSALMLGTKVDRSIVKEDRFSSKTFDKLIKRLAKKYNISEACPNTKIDQAVKALKYHFYKFYREGSSSRECFVESLCTIIEDSKEVCQEALYLFVSYRDIEEAKKFAKKFNVPEKQCPSELIEPIKHRYTAYNYEDGDYHGGDNYYDDDEDDDDLDDVVYNIPNPSKQATKPVQEACNFSDWGWESLTTNPSTQAAKPVQEACNSADWGWESLTTNPSTQAAKPVQEACSSTDWDWESVPMESSQADPKSNELCLRIDYPNDVIFVDQPAQLEEAIIDILNYDVVGLDSEWKPSFGMNISSIQKVDLMQVATWDKCYLLDVLNLNSGVWTKFFERIISSQNILKIGYGLKSDWDAIKATFSKDVFSKPNYVLDLQDFSTFFFAKYPEAFDSRKGESDVKGLSKLTFIILDKYLNKDEQSSNWQNRPLREKQIKYAATDAYCLLQIYEKLNDKCRELKVDLQSLIDSFISGKVSLKSVASTHSTSSPDENDNFVFPQMSIRHFKCTVDNMLHGLGRVLRIAGADTEIIDNTSTREQIVQLCLQGDRIMLTAGSRYDQFKNRLPRGRCFKLPNGFSALEQLELCIKRFSLQIEEDDLFTRCVKCNSNSFENCNSSVIQEMYQKKALCYKGIKLKYEALENCRFPNIKVFYVCIKCGHIYWDGCHQSRWKDKVQEILFGNQLDKTTASVFPPVSEKTEDVITIN